MFTNKISDNIINLHNIMKNTKVLCKMNRYKIQMARVGFWSFYCKKSVKPL